MNEGILLAAMCKTHFGRTVFAQGPLCGSNYLFISYCLFIKFIKTLKTQILYNAPGKTKQATLS